MFDVFYFYIYPFLYQLRATLLTCLVVLVLPFSFLKRVLVNIYRYSLNDIDFVNLLLLSYVGKHTNDNITYLFDWSLITKGAKYSSGIYIPDVTIFINKNDSSSNFIIIDSVTYTPQHPEWYKVKYIAISVHITISYAWHIEIIHVMPRQLKDKLKIISINSPLYKLLIQNYPFAFELYRLILSVFIESSLYIYLPILKYYNYITPYNMKIIINNIYNNYKKVDTEYSVGLGVGSKIGDTTVKIRQSYKTFIKQYCKEKHCTLDLETLGEDLVLDSFTCIVQHNLEHVNTQKATLNPFTNSFLLNSSNIKDTLYNIHPNLKILYIQFISNYFSNNYFFLRI
jgi:hypothetical protein